MGEEHMKEETAILEELKAGNKNLEWLSKNFPELKKKYPKKFVAIQNQSIVVTANSLEALIKILKEKFCNSSDFLIDFIPDDNYILVV